MPRSPGESSPGSHADRDAQRFEFDFDPQYRVPALAFGVTPRTSYVELRADEIFVRYGPWSMRTPRSNVRSAELSGDFAWIKTAGPPRLSLSDKGVSFTTNGRAAVCLSFREPVSVYDPTGKVLTHPGATLSVREPEEFLRALGQQESPATGDD